MQLKMYSGNLRKNGSLYSSLYLENTPGNVSFDSELGNKKHIHTKKDVWGNFILSLIMYAQELRFLYNYFPL